MELPTLRPAAPHAISPFSLLQQIPGGGQRVLEFRYCLLLRGVVEHEYQMQDAVSRQPRCVDTFSRFGSRTASTIDLLGHGLLVRVRGRRVRCGYSNPCHVPHQRAGGGAWREIARFGTSSCMSSSWVPGLCVRLGATPALRCRPRTVMLARGESGRGGSRERERKRSEPLSGAARLRTRLRELPFEQRVRGGVE